MAALTSEIVANSNSPIQVLSANVYSNAVANGTSWRITASGFTSPASSINYTLQPSLTINVYFGANGTSADPLITSITVPPQNGFNLPGVVDGPSGSFVYDGLVTMRASSVGSAVPGGNVTVVGSTINPFGQMSNQSSNGKINAVMTGNTTGNISVYAVASGLGQNANLVFEQCLITAQS